MKNGILLCKVESTHGVGAKPPGTDAVLMETPDFDEIERAFIPKPRFMVDVRFSGGGRSFRFAPQTGMTPVESTWINLLFIAAAAGGLRGDGSWLAEWLVEKNILRHFEVT